MRLPPRYRFKLEKWKASLRETFTRQERSFDTSHRMCPECRGLIERNASECPLCGAKIKAPRSRTGTREGPERILGVIPVPSTATSALVAANIALYAISWYMSQNAASAAGESSGLFSGINPQVLLRLGAKFGPLMVQGEWWRLVTAMFLHGGVAHLGVNMRVLVGLWPPGEARFSIHKYIVLYLVTGVFGYIVSFFWSPFGLSIGASGAMILVTLLYEMQRRNARRGVAALCLGGGNAMALAVERDTK